MSTSGTTIAKIVVVPALAFVMNAYGWRATVLLLSDCCYQTAFQLIGAVSAVLALLAVVIADPVKDRSRNRQTVSGG
ncbi:MULTISPECIES: hypothetical protein [unclassified Rhodococcus (in: high G+C Gram-positive bacteria)]|uniref:hypothetical protein n=1 Tax=unclassified Rhodococcus (in: high G+C Gram-positive bacteria) TaxID=192944 RepID=UPI00163A9399|nr:MULTISPECIES: hypothetical protein [unclassified Rhodococcus (in: high G+C Gram-positive bacteria)]MBC2640862.1 hypothetical protein [Rhodococcus sp. 3A]MBC2894394.1 hypothetical protein [Rhodococcus sp. 4CII]